jgi:hypothetical protein
VKDLVDVIECLMLIALAAAGIYQVKMIRLMADVLLGDPPKPFDQQPGYPRQYSPQSEHVDIDLTGRDVTGNWDDPGDVGADGPMNEDLGRP